MADILVTNTNYLSGGVPITTRFKDLGGGVWAPEVATNIEMGTIEIGKVDQGNQGTSAQSWFVIGAKTPADTLANPTDALDVEAFPMVWNGATWDRLHSDGAGTGRLLVGGAGTAGTPTGGVVSVQGVASGTVLATSPVPTNGAYTDRSGTITTGGTSQSLAAANTTRRYILIQNQSSGDLFINFGVAAVTSQPSVKIASGSTFELGAAPGFVTNQVINIIGATTGQAFAAKEV